MSVRRAHYELIGERREARERWAAVAQHTQIKGGKDGATVAWHSPGLGLDIYN